MTQKEMKKRIAEIRLIKAKKAADNASLKAKVEFNITPYKGVITEHKEIKDLMRSEKSRGRGWYQ